MKEEIRRQLEQTRTRTLALLDQVPDEFLRRRLHQFYSPIGWHFGHIGCIEDTWVMAEALGSEVLDERLAFLFTDRPDNPKDNRVNIPDRAGLVDWLERTRRRSFEALESCSLSGSPLRDEGYVWHFVDQHECQHQETIAEMLQLIELENRTGFAHNPREFARDDAPEMISLGGGTFQMGSCDPYSYDNERQAHQVRVDPFRLAKAPVNVGQWAAFMCDAGYSQSDLWSDDGWRWREQEGAAAPATWTDEGVVGPFGLRPFDPDEPVCGISYYEAEAFARWSGMRLPTEAEWEFAARAGRYPWGDESPTERHANFGLASNGPRDPRPLVAGTTPEGITGLAGGTWEWTASRFLPYPGFRAYPYDGYSKDHMQGRHFVLRGGSFATSPTMLRRTFRNWYVPDYRQGFLGVRLAADD